MMTMIDQLIRHKWWANSGLLRAIEQHQPAAEDEELRKLLHHILVANRYWLLLILGKPFLDEEEKHVPETFEKILDRFNQTERVEMDWLSRLGAPDLDCLLQPRALPGVHISVAQAVVQVSLHSHGHRAQCATRLRALGGTPTPMDFVLSIKGQAASR